MTGNCGLWMPLLSPNCEVWVTWILIKKEDRRSNTVKQVEEKWRDNSAGVCHTVIEAWTSASGLLWNAECGGMHL